MTGCLGPKLAQRLVPLVGETRFEMTLRAVV